MFTPDFNDIEYVNALLDPIRKCASYKPKFGKAAKTAGKEDEEEMNLAGFERLYGDDPLYNWIGLDSPLMYAAHKAAGGMTSIYRQLGIGCERLVRLILRDHLKLSPDQMAWTYKAVDEKGKSKVLTLDAKIDLADLKDDRKNKFQEWLIAAARDVYHPYPERLKGVIFEIRQGYKSADSKRQNADLAFGTRANIEDYLPAIMIMSTQMSYPVINRYRTASILVLIGSKRGTSSESTLVFFESVTGYSLKDFFERNKNVIQKQMSEILSALLSPA